ncbi:hydroxylamine reductase [Entomomonas asaccharolytica]|uniref:Hydroxylamine reductase n=1 Tax=Entomomonas asaccharolytica TaxID=2785331 RepID=A0A974NI00_9GAMM|nr:hydroxylamine reductase [Entomomonas asaccharolytica]QQP86998.1 hydroxylamine reductase [Entomomonas asaccharolytica]
MYCVQCEQTMRTTQGNGCSYAKGMCGKTAETSDLQDLLIATLQSLSAWAIKANELNIIDKEVNLFSPKAFFSTLTNVNFDSNRIIEYTIEAIQLRDRLIKQCQTKDAAAHLEHPLALLQLQGNTIKVLQEQAKAFSLKAKKEISEDIHGLRMLCLYGLKGAAAYMEHAHVLGQADDNIHLQYHQIMSWLGTEPTDINTLLDNAMAIGEMNFGVMALLDKGETTNFGDPIPSTVNTKPVKGKCIVVSGHDLKDLYALLKQTEGKGINVYTHGEMLPAHAYPAFHKFKHLVGNYGSAWQNQQTEFAGFPGPIIMTSNCIIDPNVGNYQDRIWTRSMVGWPDVKHIADRDFTNVITQALSLPGFQHTELEHPITIGFARKTLLGAADTVLNLVSQHKLRHIFLIGGCDGSRDERNYYNEFAMNVPQDCAILTLGCGKYRFNKESFGDIEGLPRLIDVGQCNDAYSAVMLAVHLSERLGCTVNDLPLTLVLSWFEQKAIVILLTLLSLGVKNIFAGPTLPAFLTPNLINIIVEKFELHPTTIAQQDLNKILAA